MTRVRAVGAALGLSLFAVVHAHGAVARWRDGLVVLALPLVVFTAGCLATAFGLVARRYWARMMALGIAVAALTQIVSGGAVLAATGWQPLSLESALVQLALNIALLLSMSGSAMRSAFEESSASPWRFDAALARLARVAVIAGIAAVPMLLSMAAAAVYAAEAPRIVAVVGAASMFLSHLFLIRGRAAGLLLLGAASLTSAAGVVGTLATLDGNPALAGQDWYFPCTVVDAVSALAGTVLGAALFVAFLPRLFRYLAGNTVEHAPRPSAACRLPGGEWRANLSQ